MFLQYLPLLALVVIASAGLSHHSSSLGGGGGGGLGGDGGGLGGLGGGFGDSLGGGGLLGGGHSHIGGSLGSLGGGGGGGGGDGHHGHKVIEFYTKPHYEYKYSVHDPHHHDIHSQHEKRIGDKVTGEYSLHEADGTIRVVKYEADHHNGFNAHVERKGHAVHPEVHHHHY